MFKTRTNLKLLLLAKIFVITLILSIKAYGENHDAEKKVIAIGSPDAIVKIKVFSSFTCPHCANFHLKIIPEIKKKYVDNGIVQLIFIDFPLDQAAFNASKLIHCVDKNKQMNFMDIIYKNQKQWTTGSTIDEINTNLKKIVKSLGISSAQFDNCLIDNDISDKILSGRINANQEYSINSTPTIVINEKKIESSATFENIKKRIEKII